MSYINPDTAYSPVYGAIARERAEQDAKWGEQNHPDGTATNQQIDTEMASMARRICQHAARRGEVTWRQILAEEASEAYAESDPAKLRAELVQVAAVAVAWIEAIDRRAAL